MRQYCKRGFCSDAREARLVVEHDGSPIVAGSGPIAEASVVPALGQASEGRDGSDPRSASRDGGEQCHSAGYYCTRLCNSCPHGQTCHDQCKAHFGDIRVVFDRYCEAGGVTVA